ncbi:xanthine dehydrogenase family protein molybdopterin-binding subunit [Colwellia sp. MB3u-55]|jgi:isoquinoline 1-oxidoreductase beta subunit|uniref:xanthine dehydrogenase family protein molybdopterin-binding subunit n=1 Tax=Colwellia sp. MB3u-55 TaxID=2759810 RepID=UPI0015F3D7AA|nr:molybdopterin cofactor-binding domain-containing protein [Colwellia sp. MB3u-55]MBA6251939.1 xanthine dehydrogenase family protein molybdopterin-binding subunit [Colwellia sp. MB3u-55]
MTISNVSRRNFLKTAGLATGGLVISVALPMNALAEKGIIKDSGGELNAFIHLAENGDTIIYCGRCEMGQGISTALPSAVADEMEADWQRVTVKQGDANEKYGPQATGGSASIRVMYQPMREAGATAKAMLIAAAAKVWKTSPENCFAQAHFVINKTNQQKLAYGELASIAANMPIPEKPMLKNKSDFNYIGKELPRHDQAAVVVGKRIYGVDTKLPGLKYAAMIHCPVLGGALKSLDKTEALKMKGVIDVIEIPRFNIPFGSIGGVAVVADNSWTAQQAVKKLKITWDLGENAIYDTKEYKQQLVKNVEKPATLAAERGDIEKAFGAAKHKMSATYTGGHLSHAPMEPNASVVWVQKDSCEVWASTQSPADIQKVLGQYLTREPKDIVVHVAMAGGAFGRKFKCDYVHEAAVISEKTGVPIQLTWTREEDMRTGYYHSINAQHIEASMDDQGNVTGWLHRAAFPSISTLFDPSLVRTPANSLEDITNHLFGIENCRIESGDAKAHTRIGWYRAVYAIFYGFAFSTFADELAYKANKDPLSFVNQIFDNNKNKEQQANVKRAKDILAIAAEKSGWENRKLLPKGQAIGLAVHYSFQSFVAMAVHVEVNGDDIKVLNVDCAIDCGQVLNLDGATAQMEGAVVMGMSLALSTEITFREGAVVNSNFHDYPVMRITDMPNVRVHIPDSDESPTGLGEPGVAPFAPALSNAVFAASGKRYRDLPFKPMSV